MGALVALIILLTAFQVVIIASSLPNGTPDLFDFEKDQLVGPSPFKRFEASNHAFRRAKSTKRKENKCKTYPADPDWPSDQQWKKFNDLLGGALIKTVPEASPCYTTDNATTPECQSLTNTWGNSTLRIENPTSIRSILFQGMTCMPPAYAPSFLPTGRTCTVGGFPEYVVNVTSVKQIQHTVNFAREHNIRLVIKNTGHDFGAKSVGKGSLSIWTHHLKDSAVYGKLESGKYVGPAVKLAAGVQVYEAYALAKKHSITLVGGEGKTVGHIGGYTQGGGHSPLTSIWGMAADQVLSIQLVTADGHFHTADATTNSELFWAICGGGGSTYGVVTSMVIKAFPRIKVTTMRYNMTTSKSFTPDMFWEAQKAYVDNFEYYADLGYYSYYRIRHVSGEIFHDMTSWVAPNTSEADFRVSVAPLLNKWKAIGVQIQPIIQEFDSFTDAWVDGFPQEAWTWNMRQASRFFPRDIIANEATRAASVDAIRGVFDEGANLIMFNIRNPPGSEKIDNAVNPAWRKVLMFAIMFVTWSPANNTDYVTQLSRNLTYEWNPRWKALTPGSGTYMSESDYIEPGWRESFHGTKYKRLFAIKQKWDPEGVFYAQNAVGSEDWEVGEVLLGHLPSQNSKLCRK